MFLFFYEYCIVFNFFDRRQPQLHGITYVSEAQQKEFRKLELDIKKIEAKKKEIQNRFTQEELTPKEIEEVAEIEEAIQDKRGTFYRIKKDLPKIRQFIEIEKNNIFGDNSIYYKTDTDESPSCGVFCHR